MPLAERLVQMHQPALRQQLLVELQDLGQRYDRKRGPLLPRFDALDRAYAFGAPPDYEPPAEQSVAVIAAGQGVPPAEAAYDLLLVDAGRFEPAGAPLGD